jgi:nitroreductase
MELYKCLESRKSFRSFIPKAVEKRILEKILEAANRSPSYMNTQPWEVFAVTGKKKEVLARKLFEEASSAGPSKPDLAFPKEWPDLIDRRSKEHRLRRFKALGMDPNDEEKVRQSFLRNFQFYEAPCVIFIGMDKSLTPWSIFDLGLFTSSVLLGARAEGLGCCTQALSMAYPDLIREELGISANICLILAICMGYPDLQAQINQYNTTRKGLAEFVNWYGFSEK